MNECTHGPCLAREGIHEGDCDGPLSCSVVFVVMVETDDPGWAVVVQLRVLQKVMLRVQWGRPGGNAS